MISGYCDVCLMMLKLNSTLADSQPQNHVLSGATDHA